MLVGSFSSNYFGIPRSTEDADFVIEVGPDTIARIAERLAPPLRIDRKMSFETVTMTIRNVVSIDGNAFKVELFHLDDGEFSQTRLQRRHRLAFHGRQAWFPSVEDVVVQKLRWLGLGNRDKDRGDLRDILHVCHGRIDWPYVHGWAGKHGTRALLDDLRAHLPEV